MKLKGSYRYIAKLNRDELEIIKNALELLLEEYEDVAPSHRTINQQETEVFKLITQIEEKE